MHKYIKLIQQRQPVVPQVNFSYTIKCLEDREKERFIICIEQMLVIIDANMAILIENIHYLLIDLIGFKLNPIKKVREKYGGGVDKHPQINEIEK